jgi:hypothetical protein
MNKELTKVEQIIREISEEKNPYSNNCNNRHLWSEGYRSAFKDFKELLERANDLIGHPCTNISSSTDIACDEWHKRYSELLKMRL